MTTLERIGKCRSPRFCEECGTSFGSAVEPEKPVSDDTMGIV